MIKATIISTGEDNVGIPGAESHVEIDIDKFEDCNHRINVREILNSAFDKIHDCGRTLVMFEDEEPPDIPDKKTQEVKI